jgi:hypothetical protein
VGAFRCAGSSYYDRDGVSATWLIVSIPKLFENEAAKPGTLLHEHRQRIPSKDQSFKSLASAGVRIIASVIARGRVCGAGLSMYPMGTKNSKIFIHKDVIKNTSLDTSH